LTRHHLKTGIFVDGVSSYGRGSILITARLNSPKSRKAKGHHSLFLSDVPNAIRLTVFSGSLSTLDLVETESEG